MELFQGLHFLAKWSKLQDFFRRIYIKENYFDEFVSYLKKTDASSVVNRKKISKKVCAVTRIRTWVTTATTWGPNH